MLAGLVERVTFHNAESGFCVLRTKARGHRDLITLVGHAATIAAGEWVTASGEWVNDHNHGQQFRARFMRTSAPTSIEGIEKYLGSGMIRAGPEPFELGIDMNFTAETDRFPQASDFVTTMWDRVRDAYPRVMSVVATAIVQAGGDRDAIVRMVGNRANRAAFLMGCCAEELVSTGFVMKGREARSYIGEVIEALRPLAQPIRSKQVAPDFRRLLTEYDLPLNCHPVAIRASAVSVTPQGAG